MAISKFDVTIESGDSKRDVVFYLDRDRFTHKLMADFLQAGQLYEPKITKLLLSNLKPGDTFIDVGAHIGYFSIVAASVVGPSGRVYCFEPEPTNYKQIIDHIRANGLKNVIPFHGAASEETGVLDLFVETGNDGGHAIWDLWEGPFHAKNPAARAQIQKLPVPSVSLDDYLLGSAQPIKAIKIDVEGAEVTVLRGAQKLLRQKRVPLVVCECHHSYLRCMGESEESLRNLMVELGYEVYGDFDEFPDLYPLAPGQRFESQYIFNLIFARPGFLSGKAGVA